MHNKNCKHKREHREHEHGEHEREYGEHEHGKESRSREKINESFWAGLKSYKGYGLRPY